MTDLAALLLAAGEGRRLRPLTLLRPKPLCPVGNVALLDRALSRVGDAVPVSPDDVAVNAHHLAGQIVAWAGRRVHVSVEQPQALGTAGAVAAIREWRRGRDVLIANGDAFYLPEVDVGAFVDGWDRRRPRLLVVEDRERADFDRRWLFAGLSLLPAAIADALPLEAAGLYEAVWSHTDVELVPTMATYLDCGTPRDYLRANLLAGGGESVVAADAVVEGEIERCVVWPGAVVHDGEHLVDCIRARDDAGNEITIDAATGRRRE